MKSVASILAVLVSFVAYLSMGRGVPVGLAAGEALTFLMWGVTMSPVTTLIRETITHAYAANSVDSERAEFEASWEASETRAESVGVI